ncbi:protein-L-isoaspartate(D-aspartate) O-methyltransferase [Paraburkholderia rhynchosiae]|uniref:Protein-L-isoaspartate O-methyltransferase n=1 Tax=Paraburkholderia rhynchosiae TaxID=487049 RepID=A0A2N7WK51_9BURK|nr:protein-L-isoaspartate(D-aspartate) O-methyltransferase [Paraburkholderia rhynchosiae]PMS29744.1 protein-L-isoaspartate O-methyltransferase [Paraburkholderia rhynchosiae]CAB3698607.1 Protein-L-isoaspartate O-methyltransferase [Paraburkholderia rhynchosiae]
MDESTTKDEAFEEARQQMVDSQIASRGVRDPRVLDAMREVPRHLFVLPQLAEFAYSDTPLPLSDGQTISQPVIVARMLEAAELSPDDRVLDVGTGSGYAAAVASRLAAHVDSIERYESLADSARHTLQEHGFYNVDVHHADGTRGWPASAPFDAIIAAAGGPDVPPAWREQLAIGGRLVMPVGASMETQQLIKVTRRSDTEFDEENLWDVHFVPLIGEQGWPEDGNETTPAKEFREPPGGMPLKQSRRQPQQQSPTQRQPQSQRQSQRQAQPRKQRQPQPLAGLIAAAARPLPEPEDASFGDAFDHLRTKRVVLLGECSHGTSEFYRGRAAITRRLVERHGFNIVAVEADWPDAAVIDGYVRSREPRTDEPPFQRFPVWMWRNEEFAAFVRWLRAHNERAADERRCGFYGLDMYSLSASIAAVLDYLDRTDPEAAQVARERYGCLTPWQKDPQVYGRAAFSAGFATCENAVVQQLQDLLRKRLEQSNGDSDRWFDAAQNARLVASAERYYRIMYRSSADSWNLRDTHMFETLESLLDSRGPDSRAVVWAHNSHIGNAAATEMGRVRNELNVGQLCRERFCDTAALIGFGTHAGAVAAASDWDGPMEVKVVRPSRDDSYEYQFHASGEARCFVDLSRGADALLRERLNEARLERFIGVIYRPETELHSHYAEAVLPEQFDGYVWFDTTTAVEPLATRATEREPDLYPFGV